jgi:hypothetical protein
MTDNAAIKYVINSLVKYHSELGQRVEGRATEGFTTIQSLFFDTRIPSSSRKTEERSKAAV